ncbi:TPA: glycerophosphodiester phosphodiesterase [Serratia liquefaciens]|mgnify:CR=1 FL=1|nr:glycerophosphodiester phosphodiesterase [Serratia liquefaciens]
MNSKNKSLIFGLATFLLQLPAVKAAPEIVAHRGGTADAPENTLIAISLATNVTNTIWISVQLSKDKIPVLYRPSELQTLTNGTGRISQYTRNELNRLDAAYQFSGPLGNFPYRNKGLTIPTLSQALQLFPGQTFFIDIKSPDASPQDMADALKKAISEGNNLKRVMLYSTEKKFLDALSPDLARFNSRDATREALAMVTMTHTCQIENEKRRLQRHPDLHAFELRRNVEVIEKFTLGEGRSHSQLVWDQEAMDCLRQGGDAKVMLININTREDYAEAVRLGADYVMVDSPVASQSWITAK